MEDLNLSTEEMNALMELGIIPEELEKNKSDRELQEMLRYREGPQGRHVRGRYYAASPLEHIAHAMQMRKAGKEMGRLDTERDARLQKIRIGRGMFGDILRGRGQMSPVGGAPQGAPTVSPPQSFPMPSAPQVGPRRLGVGGDAMPPKMGPQGFAPGQPSMVPPLPAGFQPPQGRMNMAPMQNTRPGPSQEQLMAMALRRGMSGTNKGMMY